jgi:hypothetical protein
VNTRRMTMRAVEVPEFWEERAVMADVYSYFTD